MIPELQHQCNNPIRVRAGAQGTTVPIIDVDGFEEPTFYGRRLIIVVGRGWLIENGYM